MNKELKISDKSPFEKIRKFDGQGRSYWTSRELCAALGYSTYQKFSVPLAKAMKSAEADGINVDDHFNLMVEMVGVGSGACRSVENYHLTREACIFIARQVYAKKKEVQAALEYFSSVSIDFDGAECDVNCQEAVSEMEKDKIRERNRKHWEELNGIASEFYKKKMRLLDEVEDFKADASFHGNKAPHHMMYKLETLYSKDGCRGYEFLIEYDVYEPVVGIYYGCKGLILDENDKIINEEKRLLIKSLDLSIREVIRWIHQLGGVAVLAHAMSERFSIMNVFMKIDKDLDIDGIEVTEIKHQEYLLHQYPYLKKMLWFINSDAHRLDMISEPIHNMDKQNFYEMWRKRYG